MSEDIKNNQITNQQSLQQPLENDTLQRNRRTSPQRPVGKRSSRSLLAAQLSASYASGNSNGNPTGGIGMNNGGSGSGGSGSGTDRGNANHRGRMEPVCLLFC